MYNCCFREGTLYPRVVSYARGDVNGDKVKDIKISIFPGGSSGYTFHYIYSFVNKYDITFKNNYKVEAFSEKNKEKYIIYIP